MNRLEIEDFVDEMSEGLIAIDEDGIIMKYNAKARQMLGAKRNCLWDHPAGRLNEGDIVIMAYTAFGADKGGIDREDLKAFGIDLLSIEKGTSLLAVGQYKTGVRGKSKLKHPDRTLDTFVMEDSFLGVDFVSKIDYLERFVEISVYGENYRYYFNNFFNHIVILDSKSKAFKFYQMGGYTIWKEDLKDLMTGKTYYEKVKGSQEMTIEKNHIRYYHEEEEIVHDLLVCARGEEISYQRKNGTINGIGILSTLNPIVRNNKTVGAYLLMNDMSRIQIAENQRNMAFKKLKMANARLDDMKKYDYLFTTIIGSSKRMMKVKELAYKASCFKSNVLILGESGTGKSILAKAIHEASELCDQPFIQVNLNSIPETLIESEMFGYDKGAFTGASNKGKKGYFELADGGTLFLDEIGDLSKSMQVKLLQAIQNKSFFRVGGDREIQVNVRIIVATNRNLEKDVKDGAFREDLYYRINVFPIKQPPLRERIEDIYELVSYLLPKVCKNVGVKEKKLSQDAYEKLRLYTWPGNVRELENVLERAVNLCEDHLILSDHIHIKVVKRNYMNKDFFLKPLNQVLWDTELDIIEQVLLYTGGDKEAAMEILDIKKTKLYQRLKIIKERKIP
ncbi:AAA family ATPase [Acidaminobacter sp. JC074]|uniref:sigma 54-interacting transcriptional regulator n=1 Tax=Acidaminobacter sp. JC074 TaxID=2530199 RepID=UPI001F0D7267|nr:sigma 54-interacting transcriptional regulator [Acidaminobacter sp. JC074]MCH4887463.1 AAA family ATPase [Acidaminobacter sp. JC074]